MPHIKLVDDNNNLVTENTNYRIELSSILHLPRQITHEGKVYNFESKEGNVTIYKLAKS